MPRAVLDRERLNAVAGRPLPDATLDDLLFASKAEVEGHDAGSLTVSVTPDRLDLLTEGGLGMYLQGVLDVAHGLPHFRAPPAEDLASGFEVDASVASLRPAIAGAVVRAPSDRALDAGLLDEAVRLQELIHDTLGRRRRASSLGIYPLGKLEFPVRYALEPLSAVRFVPLDGEDEVGGVEFYRDHPMAKTYGELGKAGDACLTLRDARGTILSLPPVLNGRAAGEARPGDRELLIEATGTRERTVTETVGLLLVAFVAQGWSVSPVPIQRTGGGLTDGASVVGNRSLELPAALLRSVGGQTLSAATVEHRLAQCRLGGHPHAGGWRVEVPPWRPDLGTAVDVAEDVILAGGVRAEDGVVVPSSTRGRLRRETAFRRRFAVSLLGLGLAAPHTTLLVSDDRVRQWAGEAPLRLVYPVSAEFAYLRNRLLLSHLDVLARNTRHGYPQRFGEVAPVIVSAPGSETGAETRYHAGLMVAAETAGFADAAALVEYLLRTVDVMGVREPLELAGTIPGRAARVRVAGETVAELGEIAPSLLTELGVPVPVAWAEVDLTALWPLVARREAA
jgi:phenylalanyl-tRNA synthetase beta chain